MVSLVMTVKSSSIFFLLHGVKWKIKVLEHHCYRLPSVHCGVEKVFSILIHNVRCMDRMRVPPVIFFHLGKKFKKLSNLNVKIFHKRFQDI